MTKEAKYNVGDKVWHRFVSNNICTKVRRIEFDYRGVPTYFCDFFLSVVAFREDELFPTKE